ncbi:MAG: hypothetical protein ACR2ML_06520 [Solirubrobacteraceae bacterium]
MPRRWLLLGAAATILLAAAAAVIGNQLLSGPSAQPEPKPKPTATAGFVRFNDPVGRFSISHPSNWRRLISPDAQVRLLAARDAASVLVRTSPLNTPVGPESLVAAKKLTDNLVKAAGKVKLLREARRVTLGGLSGYLYLYTFKDSATGQLVAHAHYFLFRGETLLILVFQAQPADRFAALAPLFDRIAGTLRVQPG